MTALGYRTRAQRAIGTSLLGLCLAGLLVSGCSDRRLTIVQDSYVNNGMYGTRDPNCPGEPLQIDIVSVHPEDLKHNEGLRPGKGITSREWFDRRPVDSYKDKSKESVEEGKDRRFRLPENRIFVLRREADKGTYGEYRKPCLRGAKHDGPRVIVNGIRFRSSSLFDGDSVIYVFGRFTDENGKVLEVPPAVFHPPGGYTRDIKVEVGVDKGRLDDPATRGQYIRDITREGL